MCSSSLTTDSLHYAVLLLALLPFRVLIPLLHRLFFFRILSRGLVLRIGIYGFSTLWRIW